jgi:3-methyladenine DNA glycosylase Mpg
MVVPEEIEVSPRVGIKADEVARSVPWRFYLRGVELATPN